MTGAVFVPPGRYARLSTGVPHERVQAIFGVTVDGQSLALDRDCEADLRRNPLLDEDVPDRRLLSDHSVPAEQIPP